MIETFCPCKAVALLKVSQRALGAYAHSILLLRVRYQSSVSLRSSRSDLKLSDANFQVKSCPA